MPFSWGNPVNWILSRRHLTAKIIDTTDRKRKKWVAVQTANSGSQDFELKRPDIPADFSFLVLGDTGEGDSSQMVLVDRILKEGEGTSFAVIAGDVIYPSGRSADYRAKFYIPYRHYPQDIYAAPGNHDWYDELVGFMVHFCGNLYHFNDTQREKTTVDPVKLEHLQTIRKNRYRQPNMYFYIDTSQVRIVSIDVGINGHIDDEQLQWLERVSAANKPKILISGKPVYADGKLDRNLTNVNDVLNKTGYLLAIGGDTHNFQRYRFTFDQGGKSVVRYHIVNGGGGAYLSKTHDIPLASDMKFVPKLATEPDDFACFPSRDQSRTFFSHNLLLEHAPAWAVDRDKSPYHKSFMKIFVLADKLRVQAFGVDEFGAAGLNRPPLFEWDISY